MGACGICVAGSCFAAPGCAVVLVLANPDRASALGHAYAPAAPAAPLRIKRSALAIGTSPLNTAPMWKHTHGDVGVTRSVKISCCAQH